jgi:hypothetical protein
MYNVASRLVYTARPFEDKPMETIDMLDETAATIAKLVTGEFPVFYTITVEGQTASFQPSKEPTTLGDLVNSWNAQALIGNHSLHMVYDVAAPTETVHITSFAASTTYLFSGTTHFLGVWEPYECKPVAIADLLATSIPPLEHPTLVLQDTVLFVINAFLYRKNGAGYYTREEATILPAGFYWNIAEVIAMLNSRIAMRGERNGFIYHFVRSKINGISAAATHRQPEPSSLEIYTAQDPDPITMPLQTGKKMPILNYIPSVIA